MRCLLFLNICILLLLLFPSCRSSLTKGYQKEGEQIIRKEQLPPMVDASGELGKYNMTIDFRKKHFSGLLLVKQTAEDTWRTVFSTHFGLSIFDFELTPDTFIINHCIEPLKKKQLLELLRKDFSILFGLNLKKDNPATLYTPKALGTDLVFLVKNPSVKHFYKTNSELSQVKQIQTGKGLLKTTFERLATQPPSPTEKLHIHHSGINLTIKLEKSSLTP